MRILWVKIGALLPLDSGGKLRTHAMLTEISRLHDVVYLSLMPGDEPLDEREESDPYAAEKSGFVRQSPAREAPDSGSSLHGPSSPPRVRTHFKDMQHLRSGKNSVSFRKHKISISLSVTSSRLP